uniref:Uncharacterized protein n=1 Tax=Anguilla anguilla TaxID=7936 RepID=A0A0E9W576_ANGAN
MAIEESHHTRNGPFQISWRATSLQFLWVIDSNVMVKDHQQEERNAEHIGENRQLYVRHHYYW